MTKYLLALWLAAGPALAADEAPRLVALPGLKAKFSFKVEQTLGFETRFDVDSEGKAWVLSNPHLLLLPGSGVSSRESLRDLLFDGARLLGASDTALGVLKADAGKPRVKLRERLITEDPGWGLGAGGEHGALAFGFSAQLGQGRVVRLRDRKTLLNWPERVLSVAGGPEGLYFSTPSGLKRVSAQGEISSVACDGLKPHSLAWVEGAGLALAAGDTVWVLRQGKLWPILKARASLLRARGAVLYALAPEQGGIIQIQGWRDWSSIRKEKP